MNRIDWSAAEADAALAASRMAAAFAIAAVAWLALWPLLAA